MDVMRPFGVSSPESEWTVSLATRAGPESETDGGSTSLSSSTEHGICVVVRIASVVSEGSELMPITSLSSGGGEGLILGLWAGKVGRGRWRTVWVGWEDLFSLAGLLSIPDSLSDGVDTSCGPWGGIGFSVVAHCRVRAS